MEYIKTGEATFKKVETKLVETVYNIEDDLQQKAAYEKHIADLQVELDEVNARITEARKIGVQTSEELAVANLAAVADE